MTDYKELEMLTNKLLEKNEIAYQNFEVFCLEKRSADFLTQVKPYADEVKRISDVWLTQAIEFVQKHQPKYLHQKQVEDVHENIEVQSVACFQADTKKKRFIERNKSIKYTLDLLHSGLKEV